MLDSSLIYFVNKVCRIVHLDCVLALVEFLEMRKVVAYITKPCLFIEYRHNVFFSTLDIYFYPNILVEKEKYLES